MSRMLDLKAPVDYSQGYPPHRRWKPDSVSRDLVCRGYQENPSQALLVAALGRGDAHKRPYFHPSQQRCKLSYQSLSSKYCKNKRR